jgi:hypothetical protein
LAKAYSRNLIVKSGKNKKIIRLNDDIQVPEPGNILLDFKIFGSES